MGCIMDDAPLLLLAVQSLASRTSWIRDNGLCYPALRFSPLSPVPLSLFLARSPAPAATRHKSSTVSHNHGESASSRRHDRSSFDSYRLRASSKCITSARLNIMWNKCRDRLPALDPFVPSQRGGGGGGGRRASNYVYTATKDYASAVPLHVSQTIMRC